MCTKDGIYFKNNDSLKEFLKTALHELIEIPLKEQLNIKAELYINNKTRYIDKWSLSYPVKNITFNVKEENNDE